MKAAGSLLSRPAGYGRFKMTAALTERWPSGLRRTLGKRVYFNEYRGFESHSLRQLAMESSISTLLPGLDGREQAVQWLEQFCRVSPHWSIESQMRDRE